MSALTIGLLVFPKMTQLDMTGPYEVFRNIPGAAVLLVAESPGPVQAEGGMRFLPDCTIADCPPLDIVCVPGGAGVNPLMENAAVLEFLRKQAQGARYVTSVCTGALVLGAAGLLRGRRATTHWASHDLLSQFGATPVTGRVVRDGNLFSGGGVTAGIDFALVLAAEIAGDDAARRIRLHIEYEPAPPFEGGAPDTALPRIVSDTRERGAPMRQARERIVARAAARL